MEVKVLKTGPLAYGPAGPVKHHKKGETVNLTDQAHAAYLLSKEVIELKRGPKPKKAEASKKAE